MRESATGKGRQVCLTSSSAQEIGTGRTGSEVQGEDAALQK